MSEFTENICMLSNILERYLLGFKEPPVRTVCWLITHQKSAS